MTHSPPVLRPALALMSVRLVLQQIALALLVFVLSAIWLRIPDASAIDVVGSALLALIILAVAGTGESALMLRLSGHARRPGRLLRGTSSLLVGVVLWLAWATLLDHLRGDDSLRAGYLNSRFPHTLRNFFSFDHILLWLGWAWMALEWIGAGVIALFVFVATTSSHPRRSIARALRSLAYWIVVVFGITAAVVLTDSLVQWTPGHGLRVEILSLILRLTLAVLIDATAVCLLLAILASCVRQTDALYVTPAGMPDESQPRTADNP